MEDSLGLRASANDNDQGPVSALPIASQWDRAGAC